MRVVIDTNLLVAYLLTKGPTLSQLIDQWEAGKFVLLTSTALLAELKDVVQRPRLQRMMRADPQPLIDVLEQDAVFVAGELTLSGVCRDPKDDMFIACAVEGGADYLVTGDKDLLDLQQVDGVRMVPARVFLDQLSAADN